MLDAIVRQAGGRQQDKPTSLPFTKCPRCDRARDVRLAHDGVLACCLSCDAIWLTWLGEDFMKISRSFDGGDLRRAARSIRRRIEQHTAALKTSEPQSSAWWDARMRLDKALVEQAQLLEIART